MNLYEVDYNYTLSDLKVTREMNIEKETEKMYYGTFISLQTSYKDKFSLRKSKVNSVRENMYGNKFFHLQTYIFAENSTEALIKASKMFHSHLLNEASKITEYLPTSCKICGAEVIFEDNGRFFASSDYIGTDICRNCMEEHCNSTNCLACNIGKYPNCKYLHLKES